MSARAAVRFCYKEKGKRGAGDWYNVHDPVPSSVAEVIDDRCTYDGGGFMDGYPPGGSIDEVTGWVLEAGEDQALMYGRAEGAMEAERGGKNRKGLLSPLQDILDELSAVDPAEDE